MQFTMKSIFSAFEPPNSVLTKTADPAKINSEEQSKQTLKQEELTMASEGF